MCSGQHPTSSYQSARAARGPVHQCRRSTRLPVGPLWPSVRRHGLPWRSAGRGPRHGGRQPSRSRDLGVTGSPPDARPVHCRSSAAAVISVQADAFSRAWLPGLSRFSRPQRWPVASVGASRWCASWTSWRCHWRMPRYVSRLYVWPHYTSCSSLRPFVHLFLTRLYS